MQNVEFSIHTRKKKKGSIFYVQFKNEDGTWTNAKSTKILDRGRVKDRDKAVKWAKDYLSSGQIITKQNITLQQYADGFFDWNGSWAKEKVLRGRRISEKHCSKNSDQFRLHIEDYLGNKRIASIDDSDIRKWQLQLNDNGLSGSTINRVTTTLRIILKQAYRDKIIRRIPVIEAVSATPKQKDIFTPDEIRALFSVDWPDFRFQVANLLAASTGMRAGEIAAVKEKAVHTEYIDVLESYDPKYGLHLPKTGKKRIVPIPDKVYSALQELLSKNPHDGENRFIFYSVSPDRPNDPNTFNRALKDAIADILEIDEKGRRDRGLSFHSWRHTFNSLLINSRVPIQTVQSITGHLSDEMTELYYHLQQGNLSEIREIQNNLTK